MKALFMTFLLLTSIAASSQQQKFDITNYSIPAGWKKQVTDKALQLTKEDAGKGAYCIITLYKALDAANDSKENFTAAWESLVKETLNIKSIPQMEPVSKENGWEAQTGSATFESEGSKAVAMLVATTGYNKLVNILVLTNTDMWQGELSSFFESVSFIKPAGAANNSKPTTQPVQPTAKTTFAFTTTNFDDGWTSTVQADWVEVTKGNIKVLLHYPKEGTIFPADPEPLTNSAWNILVAPRYSNLKNYRTAYISTYNRPYLGFGNATENATGKEVFIVFYHQGSLGWLEFISPDKNTFIQSFGFDPYDIRWDSNSDLMNPLAQMDNYNKFAIAATDFTGTWTSDFSGVQQLYSVYTGQYAGMNVNQSNETFQFGAGNTYNWKLLVVNGMVGNMNYAEVKSSGKFTVLNNWQISFSKIENKAKRYNAYFRCIKGARLLMLLDADFPGSGIYTAFGKK